MISRDEIEAKGLEFGIHVADVQRDYVFGWFLLGVYTATDLKNALILKGGNCFRKAYFHNTRFSHDIDFSTAAAVNETTVIAEFNKACRFVQDQAGVIFDYERSQIRVQGQLDEKHRVFDARVYFKDFYGNAGQQGERIERYIDSIRAKSRTEPDRQSNSCARGTFN
jgi:predicted nucleotidyltransferase component of viral defense system